MALLSTDPIADMLTRIRNAIAAGKNEVRLPSSKIKLSVATELKKAGYLSDVTTEKGTPRDTLVITINESGSNAAINEIQRVSTPGRRVYSSAKEIPRVKSGRGIMLVSTSKGILTDQE
ncbi:MAG: 30S ribosomal protein S8, partial [Candidatus Saccharimonadales bacterium]